MCKYWRVRTQIIFNKKILYIRCDNYSCYVSVSKQDFQHMFSVKDLFTNYKSIPEKTVRIVDGKCMKAISDGDIAIGVFRNKYLS